MKKKMQYSTLTATGGLVSLNKPPKPQRGNYEQESHCMSVAAPPLWRGVGVRPKKLLKKIRKCEAHIENLKTLPYYTVFKLHGQQQKDIEKAERKLLKLQSQYSA